MKRSRIRRKRSRDRSDWIAARDAQLAREPYCAACGATDRLVVHHRSNRGVSFRDHSPENLMTLCDEHHRELHQHGKVTFARKYGLEER